MPEISKEKMIAEYKILKEKLGKKPSVREFRKKFGAHQYEKLFRSFNELVKAAGDEPSFAFQEKPDKWTKEQMLESWGVAVRNLGHRPSQAEWSFKGLSPSVAFFSLKIGKWKADVPNAFVAFANGKQEWKDVVELLNKNNPAESEQSPVDSASTNDFQSFIPPVVKSLKTLSVTEGGSLEFEEKVNLAFQLLGFKVRRLGQGTGRNSDGIAVDRQNHYAIFLDAKARRDAYSIGTDDRTFIEYVKARETELRGQGVSHFYFAIVSSRFKGNGRRSAENLKKETGISALILMPVELLLTLIAAKIENPSEFNLHDFKDLLVQDGELEKSKVEKWIQNLSKTDS